MRLIFMFELSAVKTAFEPLSFSSDERKVFSGHSDQSVNVVVYLQL